MKITLLLPIVCLLTTTLIPMGIHAQNNEHQTNYAKNEVSLCDGVVTINEINGWAGKGGAKGFISQPCLYTGAAFLIYRRFLTSKFAIGVTAGLDHERGELSYGNPEHSATGYDGVSGHYTVHSYTFAVEALLVYDRDGKYLFYGYAGMGPTFYEQSYYFYTNALYPPPVTFPTNPYDYHTVYYNAQVTPIGVRSEGTVSGYIELGFGYKGLLSGGILVKF